MGNVEKIILNIFATGLLLLIFLPTTALGRGVDDVLRVKFAEDGRHPFDPLTSGFSIFSFSNAVLGKLVDLQPNLTTKPAILENAFWDYSQKQYVLRLANNLKFHNGRLVTIEDLYFSLVRFFYATGRVDQVAFLRNIKGVRTTSSFGKYKPWAIEGIKRIDGRTLAVKLDSPGPSFLYNLANGWVGLVPKEELQADLVTWKTYPIGVGDYQVVSVNQGRTTICKQADRKSAPGPGCIRFISEPGVQVDLIGFGAAPENEMVKAYGRGPVGFSGLFFNRNHPLASSFALRKAFNLLVNRKLISAASSDFTPIHQVLTSNFYGRLRSTYSQDVGQAKHLLRKSGIDLSKTYRAYWFTGRRELRGTDLAIQQMVQKQLATGGVKLSFSASGHPTFDSTDRETLFRLDDRGTAFPDPLVIFKAFDAPAFLSPFLPKGSEGDLKRMLSSATTSHTMSARIATAEVLSKYFFDKAIVVPLYERRAVYWVNEHRVQSIGDQHEVSLDLSKVVLKRATD